MTFRTWLRNNFVAGVLVLVPLLGTIALFWWLFGRVTGPGYNWLLRRFQTEKTVENVMVPRADVPWLEQNESLAQARGVILRTRQYRFPVYAGQVDNPVGLFWARHLPKDATPEELSRTRIKDVMYPYISIVSANKNVSELQREFEQTRQQVAVVVDKSGRVTGLVTHEDLLEKGGAYVIITQFLQKNQLLFRLVVFFLMFALTVLIGILARNFLGRRVLRIGETLLTKIPIVSRVYIALKQISQAFWGQNKTVFTGVVLLEYPRKGLYTLGFVTSPGRGEVKARADEELLNIFLPTTPNPTSGWFVMVPEEHVVHLDMKVEDALKMVISGGAVVPEYPRSGNIPKPGPDEEEEESHHGKELPAPETG